MNKAMVLGTLMANPDVYATEDGGCISYLLVSTESTRPSMTTPTLEVIMVRVDGAAAEIGYEARAGDLVYVEGPVRKFHQDGNGKDHPWTGVAAKIAIVVL